MLCEGNRHRIGQRKHLDRFGAAQFIFRRMDSAYWKCLHILISLFFRLDSFLRLPPTPQVHARPGSAEKSVYSALEAVSAGAAFSALGAAFSGAAALPGRLFDCGRLRSVGRSGLPGCKRGLLRGRLGGFNSLLCGRCRFLSDRRRLRRSGSRRSLRRLGQRFHADQPGSRPSGTRSRTCGRAYTSAGRYRQGCSQS